MANIYEDAFLTAAVDAIAGLGNTIGLYLASGTRVGTVAANTTWGTATIVGTGDARTSKRTGSEVTIAIPAGTVAAGAVISHYGILTGSTLLRRVDLEPVSLTVNRNDMAFDVKVTPTLEFNPTE